MPLSLLWCWSSRWGTFCREWEHISKWHISKDFKEKKKSFSLQFFSYFILDCLFSSVGLLFWFGSFHPLHLLTFIDKCSFSLRSACLFSFLLLFWNEKLSIVISYIQILKTHIGISILFSVPVSSPGKILLLLLRKRLNHVLFYDTNSSVHLAKKSYEIVTPNIFET